MKKPGQELLAGPTLPLNEHGSRQPRDLLREIDDFTHRPARSEHELAVALLRDLGVQGNELAAQVLAFEGVPDERPQPVVVELLGDVVVGALLHRSHRHFHFVQRRDHDRLDEAVVLSDDGEQLQTADAGQPNVQENQVHVLPLEDGEPLLAGRRRQDTIMALQDRRQRVPHPFVVIDHENCFWI